MRDRQMGVVLAFAWGFLLAQFWDAYQLLSKMILTGSVVDRLYATYNAMSDSPITAPYWHAAFWFLLMLTVWYVWRD